MVETTTVATPLLEVREVSKYFGSVQALSKVSFSLYEGETLALLGDNGAGKSTMAKMISGLYPPDGGELLMDGEAAQLHGTTAARRAGIETVYQDLALFDNFSAAENLFVGREPRRPAWLYGLGAVRRAEMRRLTVAVLKELEVGTKDPDLEVGLMSGGQRQAVAVARAAAFARRIIILDEPTAALGVRETRAVNELVKRLPQRGISVLLISHNLEQVMELADRAVVFRQGHLVGEAIPRPENHEQIVSMIVGAKDTRPILDTA